MANATTLSTTALPGTGADVRPEQISRVQIDRSCRRTVLLYYSSAVFWLLVGSLFALLTSIKMHNPGFLSSAEWLTFGRVRPVHLNLVAYGWAAMAGIGSALWMMARLCRVRLPFPLMLPVTAVVWNFALVFGTVAVLAGYSEGIEWLEFPRIALALFGFIFFIIGAACIKMMMNRKVEHTYVSQWYLFGAVFWFPFLYAAATILSHMDSISGAAKGLANWWYGHNALGLFITPIGIAAAYYLIPKVIGKPVHSYHLSLLGFWSLAFFYNWAGTHHLVGGPLPAWVISVGIVGSMMMIIPVLMAAINHHLTMVGSFHRLKDSPTLRFVVFGAMCYTVTSVQGSFEALRSMSRVVHFTHYTVGHAHLGLYGFYTMIMFGTMYYVMPRLTRNEWASAGLIKVHFWFAALGVIAYFLALTWGGWYQGTMMNDANVPFIQSVRYTVPYLVIRSVSGTFMTVAHFVFAYLFYKIMRSSSLGLTGPTLFTTRRMTIPARIAQPAAKVKGVNA